MSDITVPKSAFVFLSGLFLFRMALVYLWLVESVAWAGLVYQVVVVAFAIIVAAGLLSKMFLIRNDLPREVELPSDPPQYEWHLRLIFATEVLILLVTGKFGLALLVVSTLAVVHFSDRLVPNK